MAKAQDFSTVMKDIMGSFPVDTKAMEDAFSSQAALSEKLSGVALDAAEKSAEISSKWTKETLSKMTEMSKAKAEPADYAKAMTDFASANAEVAAENMAAFAEIAKKVQMDTVELMMSAGKDMQEDAAKAVKKATDDVTSAAKKASAAK
ncbi:MAG TPA: phasin, PhaP [Roseovarius sp.]|nr:phasin, PhaP [Roseovarius sp.]